MLSISTLKKEIIKRGGEIDPKEVVRSYSMDQDFSIFKDLCDTIMEEVDPKYSSEEWTNNNVKMQEIFNFDSYGKMENIYFRKGTVVSIAKPENGGRYVVKRVKGSKKSYFEIFLGLVLNTLSEDIRQHFVYTFTYETVNSLLLRANDDEAKKKNINIYIEYVSKSITFGKFIEECSMIEFVLNYLQILLILREAYEQVGFIHYDIHTNNILMQELKKSKDFSYRDGANEMKNMYLIKIIDYELGSIKYGDETYKIEGNESMFIGEENNPITDGFKLLLHSYRRMKRDNKEEFDQEIFNEMFSFFSTKNTIDEFLEFNAKNNHYNNIPKYYKRSGLSKINSYIDHIDAIGIKMQKNL